MSVRRRKSGLLVVAVLLLSSGAWARPSADGEDEAPDYRRWLRQLQNTVIAEASRAREEQATAQQLLEQCLDSRKVAERLWAKIRNAPQHDGPVTIEIGDIQALWRGRSFSTVHEADRRLMLKYAVPGGRSPRTGLDLGAHVGGPTWDVTHEEVRNDLEALRRLEEQYRHTTTTRALDAENWDRHRRRIEKMLSGLPASGTR